MQDDDVSMASSSKGMPGLSSKSPSFCNMIIEAVSRDFRTPILACRGISHATRGHVYNACVRSVMLYASETWPVTNEDIRRFERNDVMMIRWICSAKLSDKIPSNELKERPHWSKEYTAMGKTLMVRPSSTSGS